MADRRGMTVLKWDYQDGELLGALIVCTECDGEPGLGCKMCGEYRDGNWLLRGCGELFQPYRLPNGAFIDLHRDAEILIQIEAPRRAKPEA